MLTMPCLFYNMSLIYRSTYSDDRLQKQMDKLVAAESLARKSDEDKIQADHDRKGK